MIYDPTVRGAWQCKCGAWKMQDAECCTTCQRQMVMAGTTEHRGEMHSMFDVRRKHKGNNTKKKVKDNWVAEEFVEEVG